MELGETQKASNFASPAEPMSVDKEMPSKYIVSVYKQEIKIVLIDAPACVPFLYWNEQHKAFGEARQFKMISTDDSKLDDSKLHLVVC